MTVPAGVPAAHTALIGAQKSSIGGSHHLIVVMKIPIMMLFSVFGEL
jgi:hypothetical protein